MYKINSDVSGAKVKTMILKAINVQIVLQDRTGYGQTQLQIAENCNSKHELSYD